MIPLREHKEIGQSLLKGPVEKTLSKKGSLKKGETKTALNRKTIPGLQQKRCYEDWANHDSLN